MKKAKKKVAAKPFREPQGKSGKKVSMKSIPELSEKAPQMSPSVPGSKADAALAVLTKGKR